MDFPDKKALKGFRSKAQSRWARANDAWWADEYEKHTNYSSIPDRASKKKIREEDDDMQLNEAHPVLSVIDDAFQTIMNAETPKEFILGSKKAFRANKIWNSDPKLQDKKMASSIVGPYTVMLAALRKWQTERKSEIPNRVWKKWELFIDRQGDPDKDVWEPSARRRKEDKQKVDQEAMKWGLKAAQNIISDDVIDYLNSNIKGHDYKHPAFLKGLFKGVSEKGEDIEDEKNAAMANSVTQTIGENALIRKAVRNTGFDREVMEEFWNQSVLEQSKTLKSNNKKDKHYWQSVIEGFKGKIRHLDILEAKRIMSSRKAARESIDKFIDKVATGDFAEAQSVIPEMVKNQLNTIINRKKDAYLKDLAKQVKERAKEG